MGLFKISSKSNRKILWVKPNPSKDSVEYGGDNIVII